MTLSRPINPWMASAIRLPLWMRTSTSSRDAVASTPAKENSALLSSRLIGKNWYHPKLNVAVPMSRFNTPYGNRC